MISLNLVKNGFPHADNDWFIILQTMKLAVPRSTTNEKVAEPVKNMG